MSKSFLLFAFTLFNINLQAQSFEWAINLSGLDESVVYDTEVDGSGNVYSVGTFRGAADFDPGSGNFELSSSGGQDIFIQKLDPNGNFMWAKAVGGTANDYCYSIDLSGDSALVIAGQFRGVVDFDPGTGVHNLTFSGPNSSFQEAFVLKLDDNGEFIWANSFGGTKDETLYEVKVDNQGNIYTTGNFNSPMDGDPGTGVTTVNPIYTQAVFVQKLNPQGDLIWIKTLDGNINNHGKDITITSTGDVYITGEFSGNIDGDPGAPVFSFTSEGSYDVFLVKLDSNGNFIWGKSFGGSGHELSSDIALTLTNDILLVGTFENTVDFDPGTGQELRTSLGSNDVYLWKIDANGDLLWVNAFGGSSHDEGFSLVVNSHDQIILTGFYKLSMDVNPGPGGYLLQSEGEYDCFITKFTNNGDFMGAQSFGGWGWDFAYSISIDNSDKLYLSGLFNEVADLDPDYATELLVTSGGDYDGYVIKISDAGLLTDEIQKNSLSIFPNPVDNNFTIDLGDIESNARMAIFDALGRIVLQKDYNNLQYIHISFDEYSTGAYFVKIESGNSSRTTKIFKN